MYCFPQHKFVCIHEKAELIFSYSYVNIFNDLGRGPSYVGIPGIKKFDNCVCVCVCVFALIYTFEVSVFVVCLCVLE